MKRERVKSAISHMQTDFVPYNIELTSQLSERLCAHLKIEKSELWAWFGNHIEKVGYNKGANLDNEIYEDEYGVKWDRSGLDKDIGIIKEYALKEPEMKGYVFPSPDLGNVKVLTQKLLGRGNDSFKFGKIGTAFFERAWSLRGFENFLMDLLLEEAFVEELFEQIQDFNLRIIDEALKYDIDGFYFGDDYGQQNGLLMSPDIWRSLIKPHLAVMFERVKKAGKVVALHSCGDISKILGDLIDIGLDVYQTFQPEIYDMKKIKREYGSDLTFWGGISTQQTLPFVKPSQLKEIVWDTLVIMGEGGGYIAAPTHQVPADVPVENIIALADVLKNQQ
jgi:uroporphyrinogen decarboxylase